LAERKESYSSPSRNVHDTSAKETFAKIIFKGVHPIIVRAQQSFKQLSLDDNAMPTPNFPDASMTTYTLGGRRWRVVRVVGE
jgi:hypothetical protein